MGLKQFTSFTSDTGMILVLLPLQHFQCLPLHIAGLEKILRLLQALSQILAAISATPEDIKIWLLLRAQFALGTFRIGSILFPALLGSPMYRNTVIMTLIPFPGRRYLRFFRFIDAFLKAWTCFLTTSGLELLLGVGKFGFLGGYLLLESATIVSLPSLHH
jgi:hypothetical protein